MREMRVEKGLVITNWTGETSQASRTKNEALHTHPSEAMIGPLCLPVSTSRIVSPLSGLSSLSVDQTEVLSGSLLLGTGRRERIDSRRFTVGLTGTETFAGAVFSDGVRPRSPTLRDLTANGCCRCTAYAREFTPMPGCRLLIASPEALMTVVARPANLEALLRTPARRDVVCIGDR